MSDSSKAMNPTLALTIASTKAYFRAPVAVFFAFLLPVLIMGLLGLLNMNGFGSLRFGIVDEARNTASAAWVDGMRQAQIVEINVGDQASELQALEKGDRDVVLVLPTGFGEQREPMAIPVYTNAADPIRSEIGLSVVNRALDEAAFKAAGIERPFTVEPQAVQGRNMRYVDFLVPGVVAMSIMQMGLFSVVFTFVQLKQRGVLRRILATPVAPSSFLFAQIVTRLLVAMMQVVILIAVGVLVFGVRIQGNIGSLLLLGAVGGAIFIAMGLGISGFAKSEEVAAPLANVISMPMMFLSGVFFPRDSLPEFVQTITAILPLTYLADGLREIAVNGTAIWQLHTDLLGLAVWLGICFIGAVRLFRWE